MLPYRSGSVVVSNESRMRLDAYYRRFCEGENNRLYGLSHIVYACHASFPILLSPEMANLIWLNFRLYKAGDRYAAIDRVVVSDFLLSPLVRQVAAEQYEVIPEIRNYLLHLLQDGQWFELFLIGPFGNDRMNELASFLEQYLKQKKDNDEEVSTFRQVNEWAAKAYLNPDELALDMANAMRETFDANTKQRRDEFRQLHINTLANRFRQQFDVGIVDKNKSNEAFLNFQLYSNANNALLFGKQEVADSLMMQLHNAFITQGTTASTAVELPMEKEIGERLERKKNSIQKIKTFLVGEYGVEATREPGRRTPAGRIREMLTGLDVSGKFDTKHIIEWHSGAGETSVMLSARTMVTDLKPEEICLMYYSGYAIPAEGDDHNLFVTQHKSESNRAFRKKSLSFQLSNVADNKNKIVVFLDINAEINDAWQLGEFVCFHSIRPEFEEQSEEEQRYQNAFSLALADSITRTGGRITYRQLGQLINFQISYLMQLPDFRVVLHADLSLLDKYFLTHEKAKTDNAYIIAYNTVRNSWQVLEEDFTLTPMSLGTGAYEFANGYPIPDINGEFFVRDGKVLFNGMIKSLKSDEIYKAEPRRPVLTYEMILPDPADNDKVAIMHALETIRFDKFSKWSHLEERGSWTDMAGFLANRAKLSGYEDVLLIEVIEGKEGRGYRLRILNSGGDNLMPWTQTVIKTVDHLAGTIKKMLRYYYLNRLERPTSAVNREENLKISVDYRWGNPQLTAQPVAYLDEFEIPESAINFANGELTLAPLTLSVINEEKDPIYFDIYVLFPDLTIYNATNYSFPVRHKGRSGVTIGDSNILKKITNYTQGITVKVLVSYDPIKLDFSQKGIPELL